MSSRQDNSGNSTSGDSARGSLSPLLQVTLPVPASPHLGGGEHVTSSAHIAEGTLAGSMGTGPAHSWDSADGSSCSPGLGGVLVAHEVFNCVGLAMILADVGVHEVD